MSYWNLATEAAPVVGVLTIIWPVGTSFNGAIIFSSTTVDDAPVSKRNLTVIALGGVCPAAFIACILGRLIPTAKSTNGPPVGWIGIVRWGMKKRYSSKKS